MKNVIEGGLSIAIVVFVGLLLTSGYLRGQQMLKDNPTAITLNTK